MIKKISLVTIGMLAAALCGYGIFKIIAYQQAQQNLLLSQQQEIEQLAQSASSSESIAQQEISQANAAAAKAQTDAATAQSGSSLSNIVIKWRPDIARIECYWYDQNGLLTKDAWGSGLLVNQNGASSFVIFTNTHVIYDQVQGGPQKCSITFPGTTENYSVTSDQLAVQRANTTPNFDFGIVFLFNPGPYVQSNALVINYKSNVQTLSYCKNKASIGDNVVILGYPGIGSQTDITATEGIISGYDGYYYITSAKVEHGNSGGAAISLKDNCYLGIPSWVESGSLESLARILDFNYVYNHTP